MKKLLTLLLTLSLLLCFFTSCGDNEEESKGTVNIVVEKDHDVVSTKMATGEIDIAVLPEPKVTVALSAANAN